MNRLVAVARRGTATGDTRFVADVTKLGDYLLCSVIGIKAGTDASLDDFQSDILNALLALGYPDKEALGALKNVPSGACLTDGFKFALRTLIPDV